MSTDLKRLVAALEKAFLERNGSLDAPAREALQEQIDNLKREIDEADETRTKQLIAEALQLLATLLSVFTNVMTLWK